MLTILICFAAFIIIIALMSVGVMMKRKAIQGSCGGLASINVNRVCNCKDVCEEHRTQLYQIQEPGKSDQQ